MMLFIDTEFADSSARELVSIAASLTFGEVCIRAFMAGMMRSSAKEPYAGECVLAARALSARKLPISRRGGVPNSRRYSRLNCDGLW